MIIAKATTAKTDDPQVLQAIMNYIEKDGTFDYMRKDGGGLLVASFVNDVLTLGQKDACVGCALVKIALTQRRVKERLDGPFPNVDVVFLPPGASANLRPAP